MARRERLRRWSLDHKLQFWAIVISALVATAGILVPLLTAGGGEGNSTAAPSNSGRLSAGGTVNYYFQAPQSTGDPNPNGPTVQAITCPIEAPAPMHPVDLLTVDLQVRPYRQGECWTPNTVVGLTPSTIEFEISYRNTSDVIQQDVVFGVKFPKGIQMVPSTTYIKNSNYPSGKQIDTDTIDSTGIVIGSYAPGAGGYVAFEAETPAVGDLQCGSNTLRTVASVQPKGMNYYYNTADVDLTRSCPTSASTG